MIASCQVAEVMYTGSFIAYRHSLLPSNFKYLLWACPFTTALFCGVMPTGFVLSRFTRRPNDCALALNTMHSQKKSGGQPPTCPGAPPLLLMPLPAASSTSRLQADARRAAPHRRLPCWRLHAASTAAHRHARTLSGGHGRAHPAAAERSGRRMSPPTRAHHFHPGGCLLDRRPHKGRGAWFRELALAKFWQGRCTPPSALLSRCCVCCCMCCYMLLPGLRLPMACSTATPTRKRSSAAACLCGGGAPTAAYGARATWAGTGRNAASRMGPAGLAAAFRGMADCTVGWLRGTMGRCQRLAQPAAALLRSMQAREPCLAAAAGAAQASRRPDHPVQAHLRCLPGAAHVLTWHWHGTAWHDTAWHGMAWHGMATGLCRTVCAAHAAPTARMAWLWLFTACRACAPPMRAGAHRR